MKTTILTGAIFLLCLPGLHGQTTAIPNDGFENVIDLNYDILQSYEDQKSSNPLSVNEIGKTTVSKTADAYHGSYALQLQTQNSGPDTVSGYITNANPLTAANIGGTPYSEQPTSMTGYYKCNIPPGDTGLFLLAFKYQSGYLAVLTQKFYGTVSGYTRFVIPINLPFAPDTFIFRAGSSNFLVNSFSGIPGSTLLLDSLTFNGAGVQPPNFDGDFESWSGGHILKLLKWQSQGDSVQLSTDSYSGKYALELQVENRNGSVYVDNASSGTYGPGGPIGGNPYFLMQDSLIGYYKLNSFGGDSGYISAVFSKKNALIGAVHIALPPSPAYTRFSIPINLSQQPDSIRVDISAAYFSLQSAAIGSTLLIDDLHLFSESLSTKIRPETGQVLVSAYPNPSTGSFRIGGNTGSEAPALLNIYTGSGSLVYRQDIRSKGLLGTTVNLAEFPKGTYFMKLEQAGKVFLQKIVLQ